MITFDVGPTLFNYRAAAICLRDDRVLAFKPDDEDFWFLPGGRVEAMESSATALRRELREELDEEPARMRLVWIVENFFAWGPERPAHEIGLYYHVTFAPESPIFTRDDFRCLDAPHLLFRWLPLDMLAEAPIKPSFLADHLRSLPDQITHIIHRDGDAPSAPWMVSSSTAGPCVARSH